MDYIAQGLKKKLISFDKDKKYVTYNHLKKRRNFTNPEEPVQALAFLKLILHYDYSPDCIDMFVTVKMGTVDKEADIIVYADNQHHSPLIVVECKKPDVSELEFTNAVDQAFSYAVAEGAKYVWTTSDIKDAYYEVPLKKPKARITIPDIPQFGVSTLAKYKYAKGGGTVDGQKLFDLETVTEDELTRRFKQAHQALWGGGELNPSEAFDELDKLIFCKIWDERKPRKNGEPYDFQIFLEDKEEKTAKELLSRIKTLYEEGRKKDSEVFKDGIRLSPAKLRTVVGYLESVNLGKTDLDSKGRAFETLMGSFFRGDFGQFFTPRPIVNFAVKVLPITNESLVLDTSCGSGGFLLYALAKVRKQADKWYPDQVPTSDKPEGRDHYKHWHDFAEKNLYGIEINEQIARTAKMNMIIHDDGHTNVITSDGLISDKDIVNNTGNKGFEYGRFNFIITNPPFGSAIKQTERAYMHQYRLATKDVDWLNPKSKASVRKRQSTEILFIEQCYNFLDDDGYLAIVIPDGVLTNSTLQYVRDNIEELFRIVAVVSIPQTAFQATGAGVKSSVLFLKKYPQETTEKIRDQKLNLQNKIKSDTDFLDKLKELQIEKKNRTKDAKQKLPKEQFEEQKKEISDDIKQRIDNLKEQLADEFLLNWQQQQEDNYGIFMAIAEDIGYDAAGKPTGHNEFDVISKELSRFIKTIEEGNA